ncbi:MAG: DUF4153 domain-containing protein [Ruminococcus sp.]
MTDSSEIYYSSEILTDTPEDSPEKQVPEYKKAECILSVITFLLALGYTRFVIFNTTGFISTALYIAIITAAIIYLKCKKFTFSRFSVILAAVLYLFSFVFSITANNFIKVLDAIFLFVGGAYFVYSVTADKKDIERFLPYALGKAVFDYPFSRFGTQFRITTDALGKSKFGSSLKMVILGLILTIPLTSIVVGLLMSADNGLREMLSGITGFFFSDNLFTSVMQLMVAVPCSFYLFGMLYSNSFRSELHVLSSDECEKKLSSAKMINNIILYTAVTPILVLYVLFFISQANYFLSAFSGSLPAGYSYADYARQGFFELFAVTLINLTVIIITSLAAKDGGKNKPAALKIYTTLLSLFTLILIATAVSKMVMYISVYGLTPLRVYTTWFMVLCAVIFVMIIIKQFRFDFRFARWSTAAFTIMFGILCFSRPEAVIANYNISMYQSGSLEELDTDQLLDMSDDGLLTAVKKGVISAEEAGDKKDGIYHKNPYSRLNISSYILANEIVN